MGLLRRRGRPRGPNKATAPEIPPATADEILAFNAGRRLCRKGMIGALAPLFTMRDHSHLLKPREQLCAARLGDYKFERWARGGALLEQRALVRRLAR